MVLCGAPGLARALEPPRPGELATYRADGSLATRLARARKLGNENLAPGMVRAAAQRVQRAELGTMLRTPPPAWRGMPTTGTVNVLALPICFSDFAPFTSQADLQSRLFGAGDPGGYPYESVHAYYERSSYGQLDIQGDVLPWYDTGQPRAAVGTWEGAQEQLIRQALTAYAAAHPEWDASKYDNDGDGVIDYLIVIWTGPNTGWSGFWWGYQTIFSDKSFTVAGERLGTYSWQWEHRYSGPPPADRSYDPLVTIHETGHALGLPDYYDYDTTIGPNGGIGGLDMMDDNWGDHNVFSKWLLGWLTPQVLGEGYASTRLAPSAAVPDALAVMPGLSSDDPFHEYFLVENKDRVGNNSTMPADGLAIWHVDARLDMYTGYEDYLYNNSYTAHKLLRLMEADGLEEIEANGWADAADLYKAGQSFSPSTRPSSYAYGSATRAVAVRRISAPDPGISLLASVDVMPPRTTASGASSGWRRSPVSLRFTATDAASGIESTTYRVDGTPWMPGNELTLPADAVTHRGDGVHVVLYRSTDLAGNVEPARKLTVRIDTTGPRCRAVRGAIAHRGSMARLTYVVSDSLSPRADVTILVRRPSGRVVKTVRAHGVATGVRHTLSFACRLPRGRYRFMVRARDLAGNTQRAAGWDFLRVR